MVTTKSTIAMTAAQSSQMRPLLPVVRVVELTECCERLKDRLVLLLPCKVAGISGKHDNMDELNNPLKLVSNEMNENIQGNSPCRQSR